MARAGDPSAWEDALAREGRLEIGYRRLRTGVLAVVAGLFAVAGVLVGVTGDSRSDVVLGALGAFLGGVVTVSLVRRLLAGTAVLLVTDEGIGSVPHGWTLPWTVVQGAFVQAHRGNARVCVVVDPQWQASRTLGWSARSRAAGNRRLYGGLEVVSLPFPLEVDEEALAQWLGGRASGTPSG